jgi:hypothetical protein
MISVKTPRALEPYLRSFAGITNKGVIILDINMM